MSDVPPRVEKTVCCRAAPNCIRTYDYARFLNKKTRM